MDLKDSVFVRLACYFIWNLFLDVNECLENPCLNGGSCVNLDGSYQCQCPPEWQGDNCEIGEIDLLLIEFSLIFFSFKKSSLLMIVWRKYIFLQECLVYILKISLQIKFIWQNEFW